MAKQWLVKLVITDPGKVGDIIKATSDLGATFNGCVALVPASPPAQIPARQVPVRRTRIIDPSRKTMEDRIVEMMATNPLAEWHFETLANNLTKNGQAAATVQSALYALQRMHKVKQVNPKIWMIEDEFFLSYQKATA